MHGFFSALGHLLLRSLHSAVGAMGTTLLALGVGAINHFVVPYVDRLLGGGAVVTPPLRKLRGSAIVVVLTWLLIYAGNMIYTIYADHMSLVSQNGSLSAQASLKDGQLRQANMKIADLERELSAFTEPEAPDSLRRRTFKLADEYTAYITPKQIAAPPTAVPDSRDPNPSEDRKRAIENFQAYWRKVEEDYSKHFKDRLIGIVKEYEAKGVRVGFLANDFAQRLPAIPQAGSVMEGMDEISRFRDLAYHVDGRDHLIVF